jgi:hypothetical protein
MKHLAFSGKFALWIFMQQGHVEVKITDRIPLELLVVRLLPFNIRQMTGAVALQTAVKRRSP